MTTQNAYATLDDYKNWITMRGGSTETDAVDDAVIEQILLGVSRYIDRQSGRSFVPYLETRYFSVPTKEDDDDLRFLKLDADLLEVISVTNGDGVSIAASEYDLYPKNRSPYRAIRLKGSSVYYWTTNSSGDSFAVIAVAGLWGTHDRYTVGAWVTGSTLNEALDATETGVDVTSGSLFETGQIVRFDNELGYITSVAANTLTVTRGINGSTAATHSISADVDIWQVQDDMREACMAVTQGVYSMRSGQSSTGRLTITAGGVVIRPEEVPPLADEQIKSYRRRT